MSIWKENIARENFTLYSDYKNARSKWFTDAVIYNNFRRGFHFSPSEESELLEKRQAPIPINVTTAICETAEALLTSSDPIISVTPARFTDENNRQTALAVAQKYEAALKCSWYNSLGSLQYDRIIQDYNNVGRGLAYIIPKFINGEFSVDIKYLSFRDFYPDPNARDTHYTDSDNMVVSFVMSKMAAYKYAKMYDPSLEQKQFDKEFLTNQYIDDPIVGSGDKYVARDYSKQKVARLITRLSLEEQTFYYVMPIAQAQTPEELQMSLRLYYQYQDTKFFELPDEIRQYASKNLIQIGQSKGFYLSEYTSFGAYGLKKIYPIDQYNIIPFVYDHNDHPFPLGRVHYIYPLQRALNKCMMIAILNASLSNNTKWLYEEKSIVDIEKWESHAAQPGVMLPYRRLSPESVPPQAVAPAPLSDVFLQFPRFLQYTMEYVAGISSVLMGVTNDETPNVFRTVASMQSAGGERIKRRLRNLDASLSVMGKTVAKFYKEYAPMNGTLSWVEGYNKVKEMEYNTVRPDPKDPTKLQTLPDTDLKIGFRDLRFISASNQGHENANVAQLLTLIGTQLKVPDVVPLILKKLNIPEAEEVIKSMDFRRQAEQQMAQMQNTIQQLEKASQQQAQEIEQKTKQLGVSDLNTKMVRFLEQTKTKYKDDINARKEIDNLIEQFNPSQLGANNGSIANAGSNQPNTGGGAIATGY